MATPIPINHCAFDAQQIVRATGASFCGKQLEVSGVGIDSRNIAPKALFVALRGERDGHDFIPAAAERGAAAAMVEQGRSHPALPCFEVADTLIALGELARFHLERTRAVHPLPIIAIGGAAGKTTTKELTAALMRASFGHILATPGNLNNLIGVPMTLFTLTPQHRAAVLECGTNQRGEISWLGSIVRPDVALVLNVDIEHTEGLGSLAGVADEEAALFSAARVAIVGTAEKMLTERLPPEMCTITFGADAAADVRLLHRRMIAAGRQRVIFGLARWMVEADSSVEFEATLNLLGAATAENTAAAIAAVAAVAAPLRPDRLDALAHALSLVHPLPGRLSTRKAGRIVAIDDTYNANPRSVRVALAAARETADGLGARLVVALGDMLELGDLSAEMHVTAIRDALAVHPDRFVAVGGEFAAALKQLPDTVASGIVVAGNSSEGAALVGGLIRPSDVLLVKGSRGMAMERIIDALPAV
jgi:UDP-N-acetylmuramoyl-tripeptide--D-alanyl-D-alanine ligase